MRHNFKKFLSFLGMKKLGIVLHMFLRKVYNKVCYKRKNKLALGERNNYCIPFEWITVDEYGAELNVNFESKNTFFGLQNRIDYIYSAHVFEHVSDEGIISTFQKLKKNMNAGCIIRVEVPDVEKIVLDFLGDRVIYDELAAECMNNMSTRRPGLLEFQQEHLGFVGILSCYKENDLHIPVLISYDELLELFNNCNNDINKLCNSLISLQTLDQLRTNGHINYFYESKLKTLLEGIGFVNVSRCDVGLTHNQFPLDIERVHRAHFSLIMEGVYSPSDK